MCHVTFFLIVTGRPGVGCPPGGRGREAAGRWRGRVGRVPPLSPVGGLLACWPVPWPAGWPAGWPGWPGWARGLLWAVLRASGAICGVCMARKKPAGGWRASGWVGGLVSYQFSIFTMRAVLFAQIAVSILKVYRFLVFLPRITVSLHWSRYNRSPVSYFPV